MSYLGELAALTTALCWAFTAIFFSEAGRRIGSIQVNKIRMVFAVAIYTAVLLTTTGRLFPTGITEAQVFWLVLSGVIGLSIGDGFGFRALVILGPRLTTLLWGTAPIMATVIAWFFLGEHLGIIDLLGIAVTMSGVWWVISERQAGRGNNFHRAYDRRDTGSTFKGVLLGLGAAFGQAAGLVLSKQAMMFSGPELEAMPSSFIRMLAGLVALWLYSLARGELKETLKAIRNVRAMTFSLGGAVMGPFLGVWMSLVAVKLISTGIAATLNATTPVLIIPVVMLYYKERVSGRAVLGAVVALIGMVLLFEGYGVFGL